ncbi:WXG100 family type VII secretion target [Ectobacillus sp. JY-23]|uniref:WXG100 family type VII secretion target n=1 Tax=Ectobacillus sp. JY-23 TaxID=2933872 RepID=UPI001FF21D9E|nr:WXG100 family type VII secretion target [Ectobacillus sp. JY-23]UOY92402.1 WXG100 family type VII secretion target [Ectobacillus sp. JY-23]
MKIQVTPEKLEEVANSFSKAKVQSIQLQTILQQSIGHLCSVWKGSKKETFQKQFGQSVRMMDKYIQALHQTERELKSIATKFRQADARTGSNKILEKDSMPQDVWDGIYKGTGKAIEETVDGVKELLSDPGEVVENLVQAVSHPVDTWNSMKDVLVRSWDEEVVNGDVESRSEWFSYGVVQIGIGFLGAKGVDKVMKMTESINLMSTTANSLQSTNKLKTVGIDITSPTGMWGKSLSEDVFQNSVKMTLEDGRTINVRNGHLAEGEHPTTKVPFDEKGFPIFESYAEQYLNVEDYTKGRDVHFRRASKALYEEIQQNPEIASLFTPDEIEDFKYGDVPERFTWHHHQDFGRMQLVDYETHRKTGHTGGYHIWGSAK